MTGLGFGCVGSSERPRGCLWDQVIYHTSTVECSLELEWLKERFFSWEEAGSFFPTDLSFISHMIWRRSRLVGKAL